MAGKLGASQKKIIKHNYWSDRHCKTGDAATQLPVQSTTDVNNRADDSVRWRNRPLSCQR
ncbi:hypothetical protein COO91_11110 (plasmid) [Nostoc flagelliforme CCNUN1]|uniref:Uncharacterized protein n=1 Tax=Nostoc flagelliforme CCNUN1 TaxID=2038116 RepID=A0A2K8TBA1_9NOSO|nr:hypothetical protein [Nostoc flagelliforme]AUB44863.1 hypothetical protein COO91_11110 [Nostoc flagelliforme CCNUN1]